MSIICKYTAIAGLLVWPVVYSSYSLYWFLGLYVIACVGDLLLRTQPSVDLKRQCVAVTIALLMTWVGMWCNTVSYWREPKEVRAQWRDSNPGISGRVGYCAPTLSGFPLRLVVGTGGIGDDLRWEPWETGQVTIEALRGANKMHAAPRLPIEARAWALWINMLMITVVTWVVLLLVAEGIVLRLFAYDWLVGSIGGILATIWLYINSYY